MMQQQQQQVQMMQQQQFVQPVAAVSAPPGHSLMAITCPATACGGMNIRVQTASGLMEVTVPAGVQAGQVFQIAVPNTNVPTAPAVPV